MATERKRKLARLMLLALTLAATLVAAEALVRLLGLAPQARRISTGEVNSLFRDSDNPLLGYELRPNARDSDREHSPESKTNSHGQWDRERQVEKPAGTRRILLLGDSVVFGGDVFDYRHTLSGQLEGMLKKEGVEVLNFGVPGYCTRSEVELLKQKGVRFQPDLVVLLWVWNDYVPSGDLGRTVERTQPEFARWLFLRSHLFRALSLGLNLFSFRDLLMRVQDHQQALGDNNVSEGFALLRELSQEHNFEVMVAIWPYFGPDGICELESYQLEPHTYRRVGPTETLTVEKLAEETALTAHRLSPFMTELTSLPEDQVAHYYTVDGMHATEAGCELGALALKRMLETTGWLGPTVPATEPSPAPR